MSVIAVSLQMLEKVLQKCSLSSRLPNVSILSKPLNLIGYHGNRKAEFAKKYLKKTSQKP